MNQVTQVEISGDTYNIAQVSAKQQFKIMLKITKAGAAPFLAALATTDKLNIIGGTVIAALFEKIADDDLEEITNILLGNVRKHGDEDPINIDDYQGNMMLYIDIVKHALMVNYSDFTQFLTLTLQDDEPSAEQEAKK